MCAGLDPHPWAIGAGALGIAAGVVAIVMMLRDRRRRQVGEATSFRTYRADDLARMIDAAEMPGGWTKPAGWLR